MPLSGVFGYPVVKIALTRKKRPPAPSPTSYRSVARLLGCLLAHFLRACVLTCLLASWLACLVKGVLACVACLRACFVLFACLCPRALLCLFVFIPCSLGSVSIRSLACLLACLLFCLLAYAHAPCVACLRLSPVPLVLCSFVRLLARLRV